MTSFLFVFLFFCMLSVNLVNAAQQHQQQHSSSASANKGIFGVKISSFSEEEMSELLLPPTFVSRQPQHSRDSVELVDNDDDDDEGARFAKTYQEEFQSLGHSESAYLRRDRQRHLQSLVVPVVNVGQRQQPTFETEDIGH